MFQGLNGIFFYDYNLKRFKVAFNEYKYIQVEAVKGNLVIFYNPYSESDSLYAYILYEYSNRRFIYKGNYPYIWGSRHITILANRR